MFWGAILDKLLEWNFENFGIALLKEGQFQIFKNREGSLSPKLIKPDMWLMVYHTKPTNALYWN